MTYPRACSILYQRGIYPQEQFERSKKYGLTLLVTSDPELKKYITNFLKQLDGTPSFPELRACVQHHHMI
jgi:mitotic spindle assembly checkpoint protein MAD2